MPYDYSTRLNEINIGIFFSLYRNNAEIKSKQWFPLSEENCLMHAMLSKLREGFSKHNIFAATCLKLMALIMLTIKQKAKVKHVDPHQNN